MSPLYPWQTKVIAEAPQRPRRGLWAAPRLGKTRAAAKIMAGTQLLVVAPLSVCGDWMTELRAQGFDPSSLYDLPVRGAAMRIAGRPPSCLVVNYDKLEALSTLLQGWNPEAVVFDEAHLLKNPRASRSKAARKVVSRVELVRTLTGTPAPNGWENLWGQMVCVNPKAWGATYGAYSRRFLVHHPIYHNKVIAYLNIPEIQAMIQEDVDIIPRDSVFGPDTFQPILREVELPPKARDAYSSLVKDWLYAHKDGVILADHVLKRLTRLQQLTSGYLRTEDHQDIPMHTAKVDAVIADLSEIIESGERVVIFCRFKWEIGAYVDAISQAYIGTPVFTLSGDTAAAARPRILHSFNNSPISAVIVAQIQAAGVGISLAGATHAFFVSQTFSFTDAEQARDRIYKPGCVRVVTHYRVRNSVDDFIAQVIDRKQDIHASITHNSIEAMTGASHELHPLPST